MLPVSKALLSCNVVYCEHALCMYKQRQLKDITTQDGEIGEKVILLRKKRVENQAKQCKIRSRHDRVWVDFFKLHHDHYFFIAIVQKKKQPS